MSISIHARGSLSVTTSAKDPTKPWTSIDWNACMQSRLYEDWGKYFVRRSLPQTALQSYNKSLSVCKEQDKLDTLSCNLSSKKCRSQYQDDCQRHYKTLLWRSKCRASMGEAESALEDAYYAKKYAKTKDEKIERNVGRTLFGANQFENFSVKLHELKHQHGTFAMKNFVKNGLNLINKTFDDTLGKSLGHFMIENEDTIKSVHKQHRLKSTIDKRLLWRKLKEQNQCDVQSVIIKKEPYLTRLEGARRQVVNQIINNLYLHRSAQDVLFLKQLGTSSDISSPIFGFATANLRNYLNQQNDSIHKLLKTLHARNPLYYAKYEKCSSLNICNKNRDNYLNHVQYQTRRDCHRILRTIRQLRKENNVERLTNYIENAMGSYIILKTHRTLPWKFEFMNEVYNTLGLALIDACKAPRNIQLLESDSKALLYRLPKEDKIFIKRRDFDYNIYADLSKIDDQHTNALNRIDGLEKRLHNSEHHLERSYLFYEIAKNYFRANRFDECLENANKSINEATTARSLIWCFNSEFLICKIHVIMSRYERLKDSLAKVYIIAKRLNNEKLVAYIHICRTVNDHHLVIRKLHIADKSIHKRRQMSNISSLLLHKR